MKRFDLHIFLFIMLLVTVIAVPLSSQAAQDQAAQETRQQVHPPKVNEQSASPKININTASAEELQKLPGIGPKIAEEIEKYRETNGPFKSAEDFKQVKGVGDKKFEAVKDRIATE